MASQAEIAWAAGLFEGEGCITATAMTSVALTLNTTDLDVLKRYHGIVGAGYVRGPRIRGDYHGAKPIWSWDVADADDVARILTSFLPWLGERRKAKAVAMLERLRSNSRHNAKKTHCKYGHALSGENLYVRGGRRGCVTCRRRRRMESYHRVKQRKAAV